jgi:hypothetical protein
VPIFVLSCREPDGDTRRWPLVNYVNDVSAAMSEAKLAAGDKNLLVDGAGTAQLALAAGLRKDLDAVQAGFTQEWSNGCVEGFIHKLKLLKRQGYGRAGFELLRARMLAA